MQEYKKLFIEYILKSEGLDITQDNIKNIGIDLEQLRVIYETPDLYVVISNEVGCEHTLHVLYKDNAYEVQELILC